MLLYSTGPLLRARKLSTGRDVVLGRVDVPVRAALDPSGLVYADDQRVHHVSTQRVAAAVAGG